MKKHQTTKTILAWATVLAFAGCTSEPANQTSTDPATKSNRIVAVSYPLQFLTQRIAGDSIVVEFPVTGNDPRNWRPSRDDIAQMQAADLIIANGTGATYADWLVTVTLPDSKICNTASRGISLRDFIAVDDVTIVHSHGPEGEHSHKTMVARTWLDPGIAKKQAIYIAEQLNRTYPDLTGQFDANLKSLVADLDLLTTQMNAVAANDPKTVLLATPKLKFFTKAIGVPDRHLVWLDPPSQENAKADVNKLLSEPEWADSQPELILFGNSSPGSDLARLLSDRGLTPLVINLIDQKPESGDYLSAMRDNIEEISAAISKKPAN